MSDQSSEIKSEGQLALERLQGVQRRFAKVSQTLKTTIQGIGGPKAPPAFPPSSAAAAGHEGRSETRFFPALNGLADELDREAAAIEASMAELARHF